jgi:hypothetical protein
MSDDEEVKGYGSLGGEGVDHHNAVKTGVVNEGVANKLRCDRCGKGLQVTTPWSELIFMAHGVLPPNGAWKHDGYHGCFVPNATCPCGDPIRLGITPDECGRHIKAGIAANKIRSQDVAAYSQQISAAQRR